jgi:uncharacterized protein (TIGR00369 family)
MKVATHQRIDPRLCGQPLLLEEGFSRVALTATADMAVDETGLVHGGFVFGLADHAAMIAVNHPNVVLGGAEVKFLKPLRVGDALIAEARIGETTGKKRLVAVEVFNGPEKVFTGNFDCFVLDRHVLEGR